MFGKPFSAYVRFAAPAMTIIAAVALLRWATSLGWLSVTYVVLICALVWSARVHTTGFGSYQQILPVVWLHTVTANAVIVTAIVVAMSTGRDNIFTVPEFTRGAPGKTWVHVAGHAIGGLVVGPLILWGLGSLVMLVTKKVAGPPAQRAAA